MDLLVNEGVTATPVKRISTLLGDVLHGMKASDPGYVAFGEAYFSFVHAGSVKGWKRHRVMTLNLVVPSGLVVVCTLDPQSGHRTRHTLGPDLADTRLRLTVPPGHWVAFGGGGESTSCLLNIASIPHDPGESESAPLTQFEWAW